MVSQVSIRYAAAIFELAEEENQVSDIYEELLDVQKIIASSYDLKNVLKIPFIKKEDKRSLIDSIFGKEIHKNVLNFLKVLIDADRIGELSSIVLEYKRLYNEKLNIIEGRVTTVVPLSEDKISLLEEKLSSKYNKTVKLINNVDENILGGVLIKIGNEEIDGSVKSRLTDLKDILSRVI